MDDLQKGYAIPPRSYHNLNFLSKRDFIKQKCYPSRKEYSYFPIKSIFTFDF